MASQWFWTLRLFGKKDLAIKIKFLFLNKSDISLTSRFQCQNIYIDVSWLRMGLCSDKPLITWKYPMLKMYLLQNCSISFVYPHDNMADWELYSITAQHHEKVTTTYPSSRKKSNSKYGFYWTCNVFAPK